MPQNLGASLRLAACLGAPLDVIEPCGFALSDKALRRTAMDYAAVADVVRWSGWEAFAAGRPAGRLVLFTTAGAERLDRFAFREDDALLFGRESGGVPQAVHDAADARVLIPIRSGARSLNLATAAAIALFEALRQTGTLPPPDAIA